MKASILLICSLIAVFASSTLGQIQVRSGSATFSSPYAAGDPIDITIAPVIGDVLVLIFDGSPGSGGPQHSVGKITIRGHIGSVDGRLSILIATPPSSIPPANFVFPNSPELSLLEGIADLGIAASAGIEIVDDNSTTTHNLRDHTRLAMSITGDIRGTIDVAQVFRIQADGVFSGNSYVSGGQMLGTIIARATDSSDLTDIQPPNDPDPANRRHFNAAEYLRFGRGILGPISAVGGYNSSTPPLFIGTCSIRRVIVGHRDSPIGIQGDITADNGKIGVINTTGPIGAPASGGTPERRVLIRAATGISLCSRYEPRTK